MGALISRWKTKPTTVQQLENIDKEITELDEFRAKNQRLQKLWIGRLLLYSSVLYLMTSLLVYGLYLPEQWLHRVAMALPFFVYPVLVWLIRKLLVFLFSKRIERNNDKLEDLKVSKKRILEEVMETETYKNAKLILERFDPDAKRKAELESTPVRPQMTPQMTPEMTPEMTPQMTPRPGQELRQRGMPMRPLCTPAAMTPPPGARGGPPVGPAPLSAPGGPPERFHQGATPRSPYSPVLGVGMHPPGPPLARPILPKERGAVDRVIEYLVGDGPQNRYALICQQCFSHNGMALKEEFEYLAFRCAYCYFLNPARKTRPQAPRLPEFSYERRLRAKSPSPGPAARCGPEESAPPSGDEREARDDQGPTKPVESDSPSEPQEQQEEEEVVQEEEQQQEEVVQEEEQQQEEVVQEEQQQQEEVVQEEEQQQEEVVQEEEQQQEEVVQEEEQQQEEVVQEEEQQQEVVQEEEQQQEEVVQEEEQQQEEVVQEEQQQQEEVVQEEEQQQEEVVQEEEQQQEEVVQEEEQQQEEVVQEEEQQQEVVQEEEQQQEEVVQEEEQQQEEVVQEEEQQQEEVVQGEQQQEEVVQEEQQQQEEVVQEEEQQQEEVVQEEEQQQEVVQEEEQQEVLDSEQSPSPPCATGSRPS